MPEFSGTVDGIAAFVRLVGLVLTVIAFVDGPELPDNAATLQFAPLLVIAGAVLVTAGVLARGPEQPSAPGAATPQPPAAGQQPYPVERASASKSATASGKQSPTGKGSD